MAIQIYKYQSAESSPVSLKFATKCIEGRLRLIHIIKKNGYMSTLMSHLKNGIYINQNGLILMMEWYIFSKANWMKSSPKH